MTVGATVSLTVTVAMAPVEMFFEWSVVAKVNVRAPVWNVTPVFWYWMFWTIACACAAVSSRPSLRAIVNTPVSYVTFTCTPPTAMLVCVPELPVADTVVPPKISFSFVESCRPPTVTRTFVSLSNSSTTVAGSPLSSRLTAPPFTLVTLLSMPTPVMPLPAVVGSRSMTGAVESATLTVVVAFGETFPASSVALKPNVRAPAENSVNVFWYLTSRITSCACAAVMTPKSDLWMVNRLNGMPSSVPVVYVTFTDWPPMVMLVWVPVLPSAFTVVAPNTSFSFVPSSKPPTSMETV